MKTNSTTHTERPTSLHMATAVQNAITRNNYAVEFNLAYLPEDSEGAVEHCKELVASLHSIVQPYATQADVGYRTYSTGGNDCYYKIFARNLQE